MRDRNNAQHNTIVNSIHESQLDRKPKNQFSAGNGVVGVANTNPGSVFNNSPFVFLRQQLQEVKQNIVLPTGVVNPFQHSRIPQPQILSKESYRGSVMKGYMEYLRMSHFFVSESFDFVRQTKDTHFKDNLNRDWTIL